MTHSIGSGEFPLTPGATFEIRDDAALHRLECAIAQKVDPGMSESEWHRFEHELDTVGRLNEFEVPRLGHLATSSFGVQVMTDAYQQRLDYKLYGWHLSSRHTKPRKIDTTGNLTTHTIGLIVSTLWETQGVAIEKAAWFVPHPSNFHKHRHTAGRSESAQLTIRYLASLGRYKLTD
jgi:hypothetical protein